MKILWVGDAIVSSGFARCTHAVCDYLHSQGHEIHVLGINYFGDHHNYPYKIYPCQQPLDNGKDSLGISRLPRLVERIQPDLIVLLNDPWNIREYFDYFDIYNTKRIKHNLEPLTLPPVIGWLAVDAKNHLGSQLNKLAHVVTWTKFGEDELKSGGYKGKSSIVTLGVDRNIYYPRDKQESRKLTCPTDLPDNSFIAGYVGRNQYRKRIDLLIQYFAEWITHYQIDNAYLYLHIAPTGEKTSCDIKNLVRYYNLLGRVILAEPEIGYGVDEDYLAHFYSSLDVFVTCSQGEGFCLPVIEAMACGVPSEVPGWSGLGVDGWTKDAAIQISCTSTAINSQGYTIGGIPDKKSFIWELHSLYKSELHRKCYIQRGLKLASELGWEETGRKFSQVVDEVLNDNLRNSEVKSDITVPAVDNYDIVGIAI